MTSAFKPWLRLALVPLLLFVLAHSGSADPVAPAKSKLSSEARDFLQDITDTAPSTKSLAGVEVKWRPTPVYCQGMLDAVAQWDELSSGQRDAMAHIGAVTFTEDGWFMNAAVHAQSYAIGLEKFPGGVRHVLRDADDHAIGFHVMRIISPTDYALRLSEFSVGDHGEVRITFKCGAITTDLRFLPGRIHNKLLGKLTTYKSGHVVIASDIRQPKMLEALAAEADASIAVHARVLCGKAPDHEFRINLLEDEETYQGVDKAITGGEFQDNGAVSMHLTSQAYIWYVPLHPAAAFADCGATLRVRALVVHELHHMVSWRMYAAAQQWPTWLAEGFAEYGAQCALAAVSKQDGQAFHELLLGHWRDACDDHTLVPQDDWLNGEMRGAVLPYYAASYLVARRLARDQEKLGRLFKRLETAGAHFDQVVAGPQALEDLYGPIADLLKSVADDALAEPRPVSVIFGHLDRIGDGLRLSPPRGLIGRALLPTPAGAAKATLSGEFSFTDIGVRRVIFYLGYSMGRDSTSFLQISLTPTRAAFSRYRHGTWLNWGDDALGEEVECGEGGKPHWVKFRISIDTSTNRAVLELDGEKAATFTLAEFVSLKGTRAGFGVDSGNGYFRNLKFE